MKLIGLCGAAGAGKDTAASYLVADGWERWAFADRLKWAAYDCNPWIARPKSVNGFVRLQHIVDELGWDVVKAAFPEARKFLQDMGVAMRDHVETHIWVDAVLNRMNLLSSSAVITDARFPNELQAIKGMGGKLILIDRPDSADLGANSGHISETAWRDWKFDHTIHNTGTVEQLGMAIRMLADL